MRNGPQRLWDLNTWSPDGAALSGSGVQVAGLSGGNMSLGGGLESEKPCLLSLLSLLPVCV